MTIKRQMIVLDVPFDPAKQPPPTEWEWQAILETRYGVEVMGHGAIYDSKRAEDI